MGLPDLTEWEIAPEDLAAILAEDADSVTVIDCREDDEFALCRIEGAELIPLSDFMARSQAFVENHPKPAVVYCHHGMRSMQATQYLRQRGVEQVWSLAGGIDLWSRQVDESVPRY